MPMGKVLRELPTPLGSDGLGGGAWDGHCLWVCCRVLDRIFQLDPATGAVRKQFASPGAFPRGLAWDGVSLWHSDLTSAQIFQINPATGAVKQRYSAPGPAPEGLAVLGNRLLVSDSTTNLIYEVNRETGRALLSHAAPSAAPTGLAWDGASVWHVNYAGDLYQLTRTMKLKSAAATGFGNVTGVTWDGRCLWVITEGVPGHIIQATID